jgi:hypothetical protein
MFTPFAYRATLGDTPSYDTDAQAFFTAVEGGGDTLTTAEKDATNQLVLDLKADSLWTDMDCLYPFVGGTATAHKWNLKNPVDTDAGFRITFAGDWTHTSNGIEGNGSNTGGNTHWNVSTEAGTGMAMGVYINGGLTANPTNDYDMGGFVGGDDIMISMGYSNKTTKYANYKDTSYKTTSSGTYSNCLFMSTTDGTNTSLFQDGTALIDASSDGFDKPNQSIGIGCSWRGSATESSRRHYGFSFIYNAVMTGTNQSNFNDAVTTFVTTLGRN